MPDLCLLDRVNKPCLTAAAAMQSRSRSDCEFIPRWTQPDRLAEYTQWTQHWGAWAALGCRLPRLLLALGDDLIRALPKGR